MKNLVVGQSGGPTAAINSSLAGVIKRAFDSSAVDTVYGMVNGIDGFLKEDIVEMTRFKNPLSLRILMQTPSSYLGSCRRKLPEIENNEELYETIFALFKKLEIKYFIYIGGNDSMDTVMKLSMYAVQKNYDVMIAGIPKTIDNDLALTDHTPGYGSAAKYVANSIRQLALDTSVYKMKSIVITEIMGRNAGWLTAAAALANSDKISPVDIVLLPEAAFDEDRFLEKLSKVMDRKNSTIIAVSEGIKDKDGKYIGESASALMKDGFSHAALGGVGSIVENIIKENLGIKTRNIEFSTMQRCSTQNISLCDYDEAFQAGYRGTAYAIEGNTGFMAGFLRISDNPYSMRISYNVVREGANVEKFVPDEMIGSDGMSVTDKFITYASPLIAGEPSLIYKDGVIDFEIM